MPSTAHGSRRQTEGKWLCCADWWLIPYTQEAVSALRRSRQMLGPTRKSSVRPLPDTQNAKQTFREMKRLNREIHNLKTKLYNAQPSWSLGDIQIESAGDVPQVAEEFLRLVKFAAAEFCWALNRPTKEMHWKKHSWKHTTFAEIERIVADANAGRWLPPELRLDQLGSFEEARILFQRAERGEPDAVARIDSLFPSQKDKYAAARHLSELNDEDAVPPIPTARQLAAELAEIAVRSPDSKEADRARRQSALLLSKQAVKGSRPQGGRSPSQLHEETVITIWMMSYAISKQMLEVRDFLQKSEPDKHKCDTKIEQSYPWVSELMRTGCHEFLEYGNTHNALQLAGKLLGLSASKIQKVVYA